jgi:iron complex outermembrane receptor protein
MSSRIRWTFLFALGLSTLALPAAAAQQGGVVAGRIVDAGSGAPVAAAAVRLAGTVLVTFADDSGRFELRGVAAGRQRLSVERIGYAPRRVDVEVTPGGRTEVEIALEPRAVAVGEIVTSVTKRELSSLEAPVSVSVLQEEEIRQRIPDTVADAVAYVPSVQFVGDQLNLRGSSGYSRGAGSRVLLLLDGVPANAGDSGAINWDVIPLTEVSRVEVMKGAGSALYGTSALGGVVNVVTAPPPEEPITRLRLRAGFYDDPPFSEWIWSNQTQGYGSVDLSHGRRLGPFGFRLRGGRTVDDGFRQNGDLKRTNLAFQLGLGAGRDTLALFGSWARERYGAPLLWCTRGECPDPRNLAFQPARVPASALDDRTSSDKGRVHVTHRRRWSDRVRTFERLHLQRNDWTTDFGDSRIGAVADRAGGELRFDWRTARWLFLTLGAEAEYTEVEGRNFFGTSLGGVDKVAVHDLTLLALYIQGELGLTRWLALTAGARLDQGLLDGGTLADPWTSQLSPRLGAVLSPDALTRVRASIGRGFRTPSADELFTATQVSGFLVVPNPDLRPERSLAGELGVQRLVTSWLSLDVAGFFYEFEDLIEADTVLSPRGIEIQFRNLPEASVKGVEAVGMLSVLRERLRGFVAYTYLDHQDESTGEPLAYRPNHLLTASGTLSLGALELGADYRFASAFDRVKVFTGRRTDPVVPMRVLDARLAYRFGRQTIRFLVNNAANYGYTTIERNLEPIRRYTLSLELEF